METIVGQIPRSMELTNRFELLFPYYKYGVLPIVRSQQGGYLAIETLILLRKVGIADITVHLVTVFGIEPKFTDPKSVGLPN